MKGYKGFDENLQCKGYQYEIGRTETTEEAKLCEKGFHFCENPLDVFNYYEPGKNRFCEIEADGVSEEKESDTKRVAKQLTVKAELGIKGIAKAQIEYIKRHAEYAATTGNEAHAATTGDRAHAATTGDRAHAATTGYGAHAATTGDWAHAATTGNEAHAATTGYGANAATTGYWAHAATTGYWANAATTGDRAHAATTGDWANAATTGYGAHAEVSGQESIAAAIGIGSKSRGALGCWIVCAEWEEDELDTFHIKSVQAASVDGEKIKPDTWYMLKDGVFVEAKDD